MKTAQFPTEQLLAGLNETERKHAPPILYVSGNTQLLSRGPRISVIGSREASAEGLSKARLVAEIIVKRGGVVVSGLASGVDTAAHMAAIAASGSTIAVIGTPLDRAYPNENAQLQEKIAAEHLLVSQFSVDSVVTPKNFIMRNRTMALLSHASIIVEAGVKSGTEHQGWEAIRLGRILLLPDALVSAGFGWPEKMCDYGAIRFKSSKVLESLLDELLPTVDGEVSSEISL